MVTAAHDRVRVSDGASGGGGAIAVAGGVAVAGGDAIVGARGFERLVESLYGGGECMLEGFVLPEKHPPRSRMTSCEHVVHVTVRHRPHCARTRE